MQSAWKETIAGGTPQAERAEFEQLARDIMKMQLKNAKTAGAFRPFKDRGIAALHLIWL